MKHKSSSQHKFTMEEESNGKLALFDTLLKLKKGKISVLVYKKPTHADQYLRYNSPPKILQGKCCFLFV